MRFPLLLLALFSLGCSGPWDQLTSCTVTDGVVLCRCAPSFKERVLPHPDGKPAPAGVVVFECGPDRLPIEIITNDVRLAAPAAKVKEASP